MHTNFNPGDMLTGATVLWILSTAAHTLRTPDPTDSKFYQFLYKFVQGLVANWFMAFPEKK